MSDKIAEIRDRHKLADLFRNSPSMLCPKTHEDRATLLAEVERLTRERAVQRDLARAEVKWLTRERDNARAEVERLRNQTWYLLFGGSSVDGRGTGEYVGRTTDKKAAQKHWQKCKKNPCSVGGVVIVTDTKRTYVVFPKDWENGR